MQTTWNQQLVKQNNKSLVLQLIIEQAPLSRADISGVSGLNKSTVSSLVSELLEEDLIYETGPGESSGGRRPVMLLFNQTSGFSIGIDIGVNYVLGVLTDLQGNIVHETNLSLTYPVYNDVIIQVKKMIHSFLQIAPKSRYGVVGIGIGVPGIVDKTGHVLLAPNLGWKETDILSEIKEMVNLPIIIENEANAGAYGEKRFGAGQDYENIIYISAGIGIGVGLILQNDLYRGFSGFSGEAGHMIIDLAGRKCSCGRNGCWEAYASEHALVNEAKQLYTIQDLTLEGLIDKANNQEASAIELFQQVGEYFGFGLANIINTLNPQQIIIGNRLTMAKKWLKDPIDETLQQHALVFHQQNLQVDFSKLSIHSAALGMSAFVVEKFFKEANLL